MVAADARPVPRYGVAYRLTFPLYDATGGLIVGAIGLVSQISKDGLAFVGSINGPIEIGASGMYYLDLTAAEMTARTVALKITSTSANARPMPLTLLPEMVGDFRVGGSAGALTYTWTEYQANGVTPLSGVDVWISNDLAGASVVASGVTNGLGQVVFLLDPGSYYIWRQKAGWAPATNPTVVTVS